MDVISLVSRFSDEDREAEEPSTPEALRARIPALQEAIEATETDLAHTKEELEQLSPEDREKKRKRLVRLKIRVEKLKRLVRPTAKEADLIEEEAKDDLGECSLSLLSYFSVYRQGLPYIWSL